VVGDYIDDPNKAGTVSRTGHKYDATSTLAKYSGGANGWGWGYGKTGEGLRSALLSNGWVIMGESSTTIGSAVFDGTETDGQWYDGLMGEILNSDGSGIYGKPWAALDDGRVVTPYIAGYMKTGITWYVYSLVQDPALQPAGSIGATGEDFSVLLAPNVVGVVWAGDYMVEPAG